MPSSALPFSSSVPAVVTLASILKSLSIISLLIPTPVSIIIKDGLNGHVIKSRSAKEFSSCLIDALLNMSNNKQKCVDSIERYSWNNVIKEIIEVYHEASN